MIKKIGIEMEGGICDTCYDNMKCIYPKMRRSRDRSVIVPGRCERHQESLESRELKVCFPYTAMNRLEEFIRDLYNTSFTQNATCGNHMHFSFTSLKQHFVQSDFVFEYQKQYLKAFDGKEKYMQRPMNTFCRFYVSTQDLIESIAPYFDGHRYRVINFHAWFKHNTYEFRIMPYAESADEYLNQLKFNIEYIMDYLTQRKYFKRVVVEYEKSYIAITPHQKNVTIEMSTENTPRLQRAIELSPFLRPPYEFTHDHEVPVLNKQNQVNLYYIEHPEYMTDSDHIYIPPTWGMMLSHANPLAMCI